jgi:hypothetical protein
VKKLAGNIHGIKISRHSPSVSHLLYADDLMVFSRGTSAEASMYFELPNKYSAWSGQQVKLDKSSLCLSKNCTAALSELFKRFSTCVDSSYSKHLGLPLFFHRNKNLAFEELKSKILNRLSGWKSKLLSQAARTTLIKTVANSLPSYRCLFSFSQNLFVKTLILG